MNSVKPGLKLIILLLILPCFTQERVQEDATPAVNAHRWGSVTVFNGLPSDSVRGIAQTADGILWFGTDNGLARFDGRTIQKIALGNTESDRVQALGTAGRDLWIATQNGAFVYRDGQLVPVDETLGSDVTAISLGSQAYLATSNGHVFVASSEANSTPAAQQIAEQLKRPDGTPIQITSLSQPGDEIVEIGTRGGGVWELASGHLTRVDHSGIPLFINSMASGGSSLWIGGDAAKGGSGLFRLATERASRIALSIAKINAVIFDRGTIWAGSDRYGISRYDENSGSIQNFTVANTSGGLRSDTIYSIFTDREGIVWIGTNRGVSRYDPNGVLQEPVSDLPNRNFIRTLFQSGDDLYAGTNRGLLSHSSQGWSEISGFDDTTVYAIGRSGKGLLIGTPSGIYDEKHKLVEGGDARSFANFNGHTYVAVAGQGVLDLDDGNLISNDTTAVSLLADQDKLWIGTVGHGLLSFDGSEVRTEVSPDILKSGTIWKMFKDPDGGLWIAGEHGVFVVRNGQPEQIIAAEDVRDVVLAGDYVWAASTSRGLLHARRDERFGWLSSAIGFEQGLPSEKAFSILLTNDGVMAATNRGIVRYSPATVAPKLLASRVLSLRMHSPDEIRSQIALDYPQSSLLVEVAGLSSRTYPEEFQYAFTLTDEKGRVINSQLSRDPQYSPHDLKAGNYSVEAIAFERDLLASEPLVIRFSVAGAPFPWTATALGTLLVIALAGLAWAVIEHRRMRRRNRDLAAARFDLANEAERERRRIARDLHDQTLAELRTLMMMGDRIDPPHPEFRTEIEAVSDEIRRICEDLSPSVLENVGLVAALEYLLGHMIENNTFSADDDLEERIKLPMNVQLQIYRIAQEVLTNIRRHSDADFVEMSVTVSDSGAVEFSIIDNGSGFQPEDSANKGRGLRNIKSRASLINAKASWRENGRGCNRFELTLAPPAPNS